MGNLDSKRQSVQKDQADYYYQPYERENTLSKSLVSAHGDKSGNNSIVSEQDVFGSNWSKHSLSSLADTNKSPHNNRVIIPAQVNQIARDIDANNSNNDLKKHIVEPIIPPKKPKASRSCKRWIVLFICAFGTYSFAYNYDTCAALQDQLILQYSLSNVQYNMLYSIFSAPNIIMPLIVGHLNDKYGVDRIIGLMSFLMFIGQLLYWIGIMLNCCKYNIYWMLIGRALFGIGAETYMVTVSPLLYEYFAGKEFATALSLNISGSQLGSSSNDILTYIFYKIDGIKFAIFIGTIIVLTGFIMLCMLLIYRRFCERKKVEFNIRKVSIDSTSSAGTGKSTVSAISSRAPIVIDRGEVDDDKKDDNKNICRVLCAFEIRFWILTLNLCLLYGTVLPFMSIGSSYMQDKYGYSHAKGNILLMIVYGLGSILVGIFGWICDNIEKRLILLLISCLIQNAAFAILFLWNDNHIYVPITALILMSISYSSFNSVLWYSYALVANPKYIGIAYGIPTSGYCLALAFVMFAVGALTTNDQNPYKNVEYLLAGMSIASTLSVVWLQIVDCMKDNILNKAVKNDDPTPTH